MAHLVTGDWTYQLPFGRGKAFGAGSNWLVNGVIGGWEFAGLARWTSGLPFSTPVASGTVTAVVNNSYAVPTGPIKIRKQRKRAQFNFEWPACRSRDGNWGSVSAYRRSGSTQQLPRRWLLWNRLRAAQGWQFKDRQQLGFPGRCLMYQTPFVSTPTQRRFRTHSTRAISVPMERP